MTNVFHLTVQARDPLIAREGRPMTDGQPMRSLDWLYPSVVAGSLRSLVAKQVGHIVPAELRQIAVSGLFPVADSGCGRELHLPPPADISVRRASPKGPLEAFASRPEAIPDDSGCSGTWTGNGSNAVIGRSLSDEGLLPVVLSPKAGDDFKPEKLPAWWSVSKIAEWLTNATGESFLPATTDWPNGFLDAAAREHRIHVVIDPNTLAVKDDAALFQTTGLSAERFRHGDDWVDANLAIRVETEPAVTALFQPTLQSLNVEHPLGGERRLVHWRSADEAALWDCPSAVSSALQNVIATPMTGVRLMLATPALFANGWLPGWLTFQSGHWIGTPPGLSSSDLKLRLVGVRCDRWLPISGWDYETNQPKAIRRMVPAGAIYFFELESGTAAPLSQLWLRSVSDQTQDRLDGFGLSLWGVWS